MLTRMLDARGTLSDSLRFVLLGGAPAPATLIDRCRDYSVPVHPTYGMTEAASQIATAEPADAFDFSGTVGRPLMWTEVTIVDDDGNVLPPGDTGELVVSGPTVTPGYYDDPETTEAAFCERGLRTGDVGTRDESGRLWVLNRKDDTIITGGENVQPGEVAGVLRDHRDVREVAVVGVPDEEWGERVGALVVPRSEDLTVADVEEHCAASLAGFKRPRLIVFAEELPRTPSGTIKRAAVREILLDSERVDVADAEETAEASREVAGETPASAESSGSAESAVSEDSSGADASTAGESADSDDAAESDAPTTPDAVEESPTPTGEDEGDDEEGEFEFGTEQPVGDETDDSRSAVDATEDADAGDDAGETAPESVEEVISDADGAAVSDDDVPEGRENGATAESTDDATEATDDERASVSDEQRDGPADESGSTDASE
jgi:O-succinylbenzoic acid--CoA ligase